MLSKCRPGIFCTPEEIRAKVFEHHWPKQNHCDHCVVIVTDNDACQTREAKQDGGAYLFDRFFSLVVTAGGTRILICPLMIATSNYSIYRPAASSH
jgi:hypothetical protein